MKYPKSCLAMTVLLAAWSVGAHTQGLNASQANGTHQRVSSEAPDGWLVTPAEALEFKGEDGFNEAPALRARALLPLINILKPEPTPDLKVKAPFAIAVQFQGQPDAAIDPATFKVLYGGFRVDITSRITKFVKVNQDGFSLENAKIPVGKHRLTMQVQDEKQRMAERELRLEVE